MQIALAGIVKFCATLMSSSGIRCMKYNIHFRREQKSRASRVEPIKFVNYHSRDIKTMWLVDFSSLYAVFSETQFSDIPFFPVSYSSNECKCEIRTLVLSSGKHTNKSQFMIFDNRQRHRLISYEIISVLFLLLFVFIYLSTATTPLVLSFTRLITLDLFYAP